MLSIALFSTAVSLLAFYSGFGLGTLLMPFLSLYFPVPLAIWMTAVVHLFHNLLKSALLFKAIDFQIFFRFGLVACLAAIPGALLLKMLSTQQPITEYWIFGIHAQVSVLHIVVGCILIFFASFPFMATPSNLYVNGLLSGFFGGLTGNQGAFRSVFLSHVKLSKESFIATNAAIALAVDCVRVVVYSLTLSTFINTIPVLAAALAGSLFGVILGALFLRAVTIELIQKIITVLLYLFGISFILGLL